MSFEQLLNQVIILPEISLIKRMLYWFLAIFIIFAVIKIFVYDSVNRCEQIECLNFTISLIFGVGFARMLVLTLF